MPWTLFSYGLSKPPKTALRRALWACGVLLFSVALLPFVIAGVVEQWASGGILGGLMMSWLAGLLAFGAGAAVYTLVRMVRERRAAMTPRHRPLPGEGHRSRRGQAPR